MPSNTGKLHTQLIIPRVLLYVVVHVHVLGYMVRPTPLVNPIFRTPMQKSPQKNKFHGPSPLGSAWYAHRFTTPFRLISLYGK